MTAVNICSRVDISSGGMTGSKTIFSALASRLTTNKLMVGLGVPTLGYLSRICLGYLNRRIIVFSLHLLFSGNKKYSHYYLLELSKDH